MVRETTKKVLYLDVASQIEAAILRGEWAPGQKLPPLAELAAHFQVSRAVVREACSVLVGAGLVELKHGDGTYVKAFSSDDFLRPMHAAILLGLSNAQTILEIGMWLERGIAGSAAIRRTDAQCAQLASALFAMEIGRGNAEALLEGERSFHLLLADASGNEMAGNLLRILYHPLSSVLRLLSKDATLQDQMIFLHRSLYDSVLQMDVTSAERQMTMYRHMLQEKAHALRDFPVQ